MTGEITLRGRVLAIGGLKDKALAAHRHGVRRIIAPRDNEREFSKLPANVRRDIEFIFVANMDQVIAESILLDDRQVENLSEGPDLTPLPMPQEEPAADYVANPKPSYSENVVVDADSGS